LNFVTPKASKAMGFKGNGQLSAALHIAGVAKNQGLPLDAAALRTDESGRLQWLSKSAVQAVQIMKPCRLITALKEFWPKKAVAPLAPVEAV
jgi:hypothetical protein